MTRILLAEDERNIRFLVMSVLKQQGYEVVEAENGEQALERMEDDGFDLLITDVKMPQMDGIELTKRVRQEKPQLKVMIMSAFPAEATEALENGAELFLPKPFTRDLLLETVRHCTRGSDDD